MPSAHSMPRTSYLRDVEGSKQLIVEDQPFLILGGELQNSSFSSEEYMHEKWWDLYAMNTNTLFASVSWEQIEPIEGQFDFSTLDQLLHTARQHSFRLVLLWFGSYKNGMSTYAPTWVKTNPARSPKARIRDRQGASQTVESLSPFGNEAVMADARAFTALMEHLKSAYDFRTGVIMVQVENEVGLLGDCRDQCSLAEESFNGSFPKDLHEMLKSEWSTLTDSFRDAFCGIESQLQNEKLKWCDLLCNDVDLGELFMAYHYARYVETVASAGREAYNIPLYTNVWQNYGDSDRDPNASLAAAGGDKSGDYPSGGAVAKMLDIWMHFAPSLDLLAPDIYLNDYAKTCAKYRHRNQPLLIPEQRRDEYGARRMWTAIGSYNALGVAPFGIDTLSPNNIALTAHYALLSKVSHFILAAQTRPDLMTGFFFDEIASDGTDSSLDVNATFGSWKLCIQRSFVFGRPSAGCGIIIYTAPDEFLLIGWGFQVTFESTNSSANFTGILKFEEKDVQDGKLRTVRLLNGDETRSGKCAVMPSTDPDYGGFPISITIPARTGIALCQPYAIETE